jgi:hypothetical protein
MLESLAQEPDVAAGVALEQGRESSVKAPTGRGRDVP